MNMQVSLAQMPGAVVGAAMAEVASPVTWDACHRLGMTVTKAARAMGYSTTDKAHQWARDNGRVWASYPDRWFEHVATQDLPDASYDHPIMVRDCVHLWVSVLAEQWRCAFKPGVKYGWQQDALKWFGSRDFYTVCALAGFDGAAVYERFQQLQAGVAA